MDSSQAARPCVHKLFFFPDVWNPSDGSKPMMVSSILILFGGPNPRMYSFGFAWTLKLIIPFISLCHLVKRWKSHDKIQRKQINNSINWGTPPLCNSVKVSMAPSLKKWMHCFIHCYQGGGWTQSINKQPVCSTQHWHWQPGNPQTKSPSLMPFFFSKTHGNPLPPNFSSVTNGTHPFTMFKPFEISDIHRN